MSILIRVGRVVGIIKIPRVGDKVWWAPKGLGGIVTGRGEKGTMIFQGGELITNKKGRVVPRWTVAAGIDTYVWHADIKMWVVGQGPTPKLVNGQVITPDPVAVSGASTGSFAVKS